MDTSTTTIPATIKAGLRVDNEGITQKDKDQKFLGGYPFKLLCLHLNKSSGSGETNPSTCGLSVKSIHTQTTAGRMLHRK